MTDAAPAEPTTVRPTGRWNRFLRSGSMLVVLGFAVHVLLPQVAELKQGFEALRTGRWAFLGLAVLGSMATYVAGALLVRASVDDPPPWPRTTLVQIAASAAAIITPVGLGWVAVNQGYLQKEGIDEATARAATGLNMVLTVVSHVALLLVLLPFLPALTLPTVSPPQRRVFVDGAVVIAVVSGVVFWIPRSRRRTLSVVKPILDAIPGVIGDRKRSVAMVGAAATVNLAYSLALYGAVAAFGPAAPPLGVVVAYLVAATVASIAPTPGGLGAMEAALVAALTRLAVPGGQAVAATLAFRLATFWLPLAIGAVVLHRLKRKGIV